MRLTAEWESRPGRLTQEPKATRLQATFRRSDGPEVDTTWRQYVPGWTTAEQQNRHKICGIYDSAWQPQTHQTELGTDMVRSLRHGKMWSLKVGAQKNTAWTETDRRWQRATTIQWQANQAERVAMTKWLNAGQPRGR